MTQTTSLEGTLNYLARQLFSNVIPIRFSPGEGGRCWTEMDLRPLRRSAKPDDPKRHEWILAIFAKRSDGLWFREIERIDSSLEELPAYQLEKSLEGQLMAAYVRLDSKRTCDCTDLIECPKHNKRFS